ncbi:hypothetical protein FE844_024525 (plasmid) [Rhizobium indicum]|uniref:hypothetical protein n=1 Tax=Rhizobium indicum TaxID=2583231 RepID=UPI0015712697|nr:hypothetical protein [Rhizobium indicum]QKK32690.1 hypothetical protein FE844_024525 [Rhizobium indicum]
MGNSQTAPNILMNLDFYGEFIDLPVGLKTTLPISHFEPMALLTPPEIWLTSPAFSAG